MKQKIKRTMKWQILLLILLLVIDQTTKLVAVLTNVSLEIIPNVLQFTLTQNNGGAFGIGQGNVATFIIINVVVLGLITRFIYLQKERMDKITMYSLFLILAGGIGNVIDRVVRGYVVDFICLFPKISFPIFNIADCIIVVGWLLLAFAMAKYTYQEIKERKEVGK